MHCLSHSTKALRAALLSTSLTLVSSCLHAREIFIEVEMDETGRPYAAELADCTDLKIHVACRISFGAMREALASQAWQSRLPADVTAVRFLLPAITLRVTAPLNIEWSGGGIGQTLLVIEGTSVSTTLSGGIKLVDASRNLIDVPALGRRLQTQVKERLRLFDTSKLGLHPDERSNPKGFGYPATSNAVSLFSGTRRMPLARWPNQGYGVIGGLGDQSGRDQRTFTVEGRSSSDWADEPNLQFMGFWYHDWASQMLPASVSSTGKAELDAPGPSYGIRVGQRVKVVNALSELDSPGEWYFDHQSRTLLLWPLDPTSAIEVAVTNTLVKINKSRHVRIKNLVIEKALGDAVTIEDSEDVVLVGTTIRNANSGLIVRGGRRCGIQDSVLSDFEEGAISLTGGDRNSLLPAEHFVERSIISDFAVSDFTYRPAVSLGGVGQRVSNNHISNGPHSAIIFSGNNHLIERNEINDVVLNTSDAGAIYTGRDFTAQGTTISENFLHDIGPRSHGREGKGIYLDDQASGISIERNTFSRVPQPVFIGGGRSNHVVNNVFVESSPAIHLDARGLDWQKAATADPNRELQLRLRAVPFQSEIWRAKYPELSTIKDDDFGSPKHNMVCGNRFFRSTPFRIHRAAKSGISLQDNIEINLESFESPSLASTGNRVADFRLRPEAQPKCTLTP